MANLQPVSVLQELHYAINESFRCTESSITMCSKSVCILQLHELAFTLADADCNESDQSKVPYRHGGPPYDCISHTHLALQSLLAMTHNHGHRVPCIV